MRSPTTRRASGSATTSLRTVCESTSTGSGATHVDGIELLAGSEVNILPDGALDYEDDVLELLDWVVASVHSSFRMASDAMTERIIRALEHPLVDLLGHPSGRKIEQRQPYAFDADAVIAAAKRTGTMLEINANPDRRDLNEVNARAAAAAGVPLVINCDAHRTERLRASPATASRPPAARG